MALHKSGFLDRLITDSWIPRFLKTPVGALHKNLGQRRHDAIPDKLVASITLGRVACDVLNTMHRKAGWDAILARNRWFQAWSAKKLSRLLVQGEESSVCFSYSYTARLPFREAKKRGLRCILGQIDPGPQEAVVVEEASSAYAASLGELETSPPESYWREWQEEVELADAILVNSNWSMELLARAGVPRTKMIEVPLAFESSAPSKRRRQAAGAFSAARPLTVLFLGQVILRKGIGQLFDAIRLLDDAPIRFIVAGPVGIRIPPWISGRANVQILGAVDRESGAALYAASDIFILPTLSDGFAITQLEAQAQGVPVIASKCCGAVVCDGINGMILDEVTPEAIVDRLQYLLQNPEVLAGMASRSKVDDRFSLETLAGNLFRV
ncbi:MAG TPA: glycosyltransferase family 4 protein [Rariglobus sp.]|jgi:glycosyltransferase involved in cell wall biosynthesis|nr:glycosyltransferase family 4 protein [Rariglobus sp.]